MQVPLIYYPLTISCVDDDELTLTTFKSQFEKQYRFITYSSPDTLLKKITSNPNASVLSAHLKNVITKEISESIEFKIDFKSIVNIANIPDKYNEDCVILSDYLMPQLNGLEFFKQINHTNLKRVLFTQYQNYQEVLSAFNLGIIDRFFLKNNENLMSELEEAIQILTQEYFSNITQHLKSYIEVNNKLPTSDPIFNKFLIKLFKDRSIEEHYLADKNGSLLLIDSTGKRFYLIIHTESSLNEFTQLYNERDFNEFVNPIINRQQIPFFGVDVDPTTIDLKQWNTYLFKPNQLQGTEKYYWCVVDDCFC